MFHNLIYKPSSDFENVALFLTPLYELRNCANINESN